MFTVTELRPLEYNLAVTGVLTNPELECSQSEDILTVRAVKTDSEKQYKITLMPKGINGKTNVMLSLYAYNEYGEKVKCDELMLYIKVDIPKEPAFDPAAEGYPYFVETFTHEGITCEVWTDKEDSLYSALVFTGEGIVELETLYGWTTYRKYNRVKKVYFGEGITEIHYGLPIEYLEEATFPSTLKVVGDSAFKNADLTEIILPEGVEVVGDCAFLWCNKVERIVLPSTLKSIGMSAFKASTQSPSNYKNYLTEVYIPKSVEVINIGAFEYHYGLVITVEKGTNTKKYDKDWNCSGSSIPHKTIYE